MVEQCPKTSVCSNFAAGGHQICYDYNPDDFHGHMTLRKYANGKVTVVLCKTTVGGVCAETNPAVYDNIYASHACTNGQDCMFRLVSDIWLGTTGDGGYQQCSFGAFDSQSRCSLSIRQIRIKSSVALGGKCAAFMGTADTADEAVTNMSNSNSNNGNSNNSNISNNTSAV